jgi:nicotinate-nucleotide adenylyltransferase
MEKIGIYGGTFDPPHVGHLRAAKAAIDSLRLDKLLLIPASCSPHKTPGETDPSHRLEMLTMAAGERMEVWDLELQRGGVSYTVDTLHQLRTQYPDAELHLCMGSDAFESLESWKDAQTIFSLAQICVFSRGGRKESRKLAEQKAHLEQLGAKVSLVDNPVTAISSSNLRRLLAFGCGKEFLPEGLEEYIRRNGLYNTRKNWKNLPMEQLEKVVISLLNPNRVAHTLGCRDTAVAMAKHWGVDETDAARAGILHDVTKALDSPLQLTLCEAYGKMLSDFSRKYPKTLHALTGSLVAEMVFGENPEVVEAIRSHTTGKADMTALQKVIYIADYMEPCRDFPGVEQLRHLAFTDLDAALKLGLEMTLEHLANQGNEVSPESQDALRFLNRKGETLC